MVNKVILLNPYLNRIYNNISGSAAVSWNSETDFIYDSSVALSADLDNGYIASASMILDNEDSGTDEVSLGRISLSSDTVSLTFGTDLHGAGFKAVSDDYAIGAGVDGIVEGFAVQLGIGDATVYASIVNGVGSEIDYDSLELGITANLDYISIGGALHGDDFVISVGTQVQGVFVSASLANIRGYELWDASVSIALGRTFIGVAINEGRVFFPTVGYTLGATYLGVKYNSVEGARFTAAWSEGNLSADLEYSQYGNLAMNVAYILDELSIGVGFNDSSEKYIEAEYKLGRGVSLSAIYAEAVNQNPAEDNKLGVWSTVSLNFPF